MPIGDIKMSLELFELEEVQKSEISDDALEAAITLVATGIPTGGDYCYFRF